MRGSSVSMSMILVRLEAPETRRTALRRTPNEAATAASAASVAWPSTARALTRTTKAPSCSPPTPGRAEPGFTRIAIRMQPVSTSNSGQAGCGVNGMSVGHGRERFCDHEPMPSRCVEWAVAGALAGWAAARLAGADRLRFAEAWAVPLLSFTPQVTAGAWASALLLRGAGPAATTAVAGAALTAVVGPRAVPSRQPSVAGPVLRVLTANLLVGRAGAEVVAELVCRKHADVLFVQELTGEAAARLQRAGLGDLLAYRVRQPMRHGAGDGIYARYPLRSGPLAAPVSAARCTARLDLPSGQFVQLACIHASPPQPPWAAGPIWPSGSLPR